jgi:hypothetical protein
MGRRGKLYAIGGKGRRKEPKEDLDENGRIILRLILEIQYMVLWTALVWPRIGTNGELL